MQKSDFLELYRHVYFFFRKRGFPPEDCEDLAQETFLEVSTSLDSFRGDSKFATWVYSIASNVWCRHLRNRSALKRSATTVSLHQATELSLDPIQEAFGGEQDPLQSSIARQASEQLWAAIQELPDDMRRCMVLRIGQDLKYREIACVLKISLDQVRSLLFQARGHLKRRLGDSWSFET